MSESIEAAAIPWTREAAVDFCRILEPIAATHGCHVALTGGCLYHDGPRKDVDVLLYRSLDEQPIDWSKLAEAFADVGLAIHKDFGFCKKARYKGMPVDLFDPHDDGLASSSCVDADQFPVELPGMWDASDLAGGAADCNPDQPARINRERGRMSSGQDLYDFNQVKKFQAGPIFPQLVGMRVGELTAEQAEQAHEDWVRSQFGHMGEYYRPLLSLLLHVIDDLRDRIDETKATAETALIADQTSKTPA